MKTLYRIVLLMVVAFLAACASGPKHAEVASSIPGLKPDQGRIYVYRSNSMLGAAIQPNILINGKVVGESKPGGFFFVDVVPGPIEVSTSTEVEKKLTFAMAAGETRYVRTAIGMGLMVGRVYPELVDGAEGAKQIIDTSYTGTLLTKR